MDIFGRNAVKEKLLAFRRSGHIPQNCRLIIRQNDKKRYPSDITGIADDLGITVEYKTHREFDAAYSRYSHQGTVLSVTAGSQTDLMPHSEQKCPTVREEDLISTLAARQGKSIILILDGIKDVGNLGAILRSALLFNADYVILPKDNSASVNEAAIKRSAGAALLVPTVTVTNIVRTMERLKECGYWIYAADMGGQSIDQTDFAEKTVLVMGAEGSGIRRLVRDRSDVIVGIPTNDKLDSLNVSVSTGIILYEINRQNKQSL